MYLPWLMVWVGTKISIRMCVFTMYCVRKSFIDILCNHGIKKRQLTFQLVAKYWQVLLATQIKSYLIFRFRCIFEFLTSNYQVILVAELRFPYCFWPKKHQTATLCEQEHSRYAKALNCFHIAYRILTRQ